MIMTRLLCADVLTMLPLHGLSCQTRRSRVHGLACDSDTSITRVYISASTAPIIDLCAYTMQGETWKTGTGLLHADGTEKKTLTWLVQQGYVKLSGL